MVPSPGPGLKGIYGVTASTPARVRPDGYVAALDPLGSVGAIEQFLALAAPQE